jgi:transposase-like protein
LSVTEEQLQATGLAEKYLDSYRLAHFEDPPLSKDEIAEKVGLKRTTVRRHLSMVERRLADPDSMRNPGSGVPHLSQSDPKTYAKALAKLSGPQRNISAVAREMGLSPEAATKIARELEQELQPLQRAIEDVRVEDLAKQFGTLTRDALAAITQPKLDGANARDLGVLAGIGSQNFQLLRGQPTQRLEINDRREMNELVKMMLEEAKRRGIEIDVTPDGGATAKKSPYKNAADQRMVKAISSGDPAGTLTPA